MARCLKFWICEVEGSYVLFGLMTRLIINYVTVQLICGFVLACAKSRFSHDAIHIETYLHVYTIYDINQARHKKKFSSGFATGLNSHRG